MPNQIENVLDLLTSDSQTASQLISLIKTAAGGKDDENTKSNSLQTTEEKDKLQLKINLINAIIPLLSPKGAEQAQFIIKLLSVISVMRQLKNGDNQQMAE